MNILNDQSDFIIAPKSDMELVEQEKQEYYLLGTYLRTPGLILYGYNHIEDKIFKVNIQYGKNIHVKVENNQLIAYDPEAEKCTVDSRFEYFESLNIDNAEKRLRNFKEGKIQTLCNLRKPNKEGIKFF